MNQQKEVIDSYFKKYEDNNIFMYRGPLHFFHGIKQLMKVLMLYVHITLLNVFEKIPVKYVNMG